MLRSSVNDYFLHIFVILEHAVFICDVLRDFLRFIQHKKREKHLWRSVTFSKVASWSTKSRSTKLQGFHLFLSVTFFSVQTQFFEIYKDEENFLNRPKIIYIRYFFHWNTKFLRIQISYYLLLAFFCEYCEIFKNACFEKHQQTAASVLICFISVLSSFPQPSPEFFLS